jgi:hypothetical protein
MQLPYIYTCIHLFAKKKYNKTIITIEIGLDATHTKQTAANARVILVVSSISFVLVGLLFLLLILS